MAKHHPDLIFCRKQPGVGKLTYNVSLLLLLTKYLDIVKNNYVLYIGI